MAKLEVMKKTALLLILSVFAFTGLAHAEDDLDFKVCAALRPCDGEGNVFPEFASGDCGAVYAEQCAAIRTTENAGTGISRRYAQCKVTSKKKDLTIKQLRRQLRSALRTKLALEK